MNQSQIDALEQRVAALEEQFQKLAETLKKSLDVYRSLQIEDEEEIRRLYQEFRKLREPG